MTRPRSSEDAPPGRPDGPTAGRHAICWLRVLASGCPMLLKRWSALVSLSVLLTATASAQDECTQAAGQLVSSWQEFQSAQSTLSEATTEYSTCVEDQGGGDCKDQYGKLQHAQEDIKTALSGYQSDRSLALENGCIEGSAGPFGKVQGLGVWPPP